VARRRLPSLVRAHQLHGAVILFVETSDPQAD
jgi:hypothetical protein